MTKLHLAEVPEKLHYGPLWADFTANSDLYDYAGGLYTGAGCGGLRVHVMVIVGHVRRKGREFLIFQNSFGKSWGEGGYLRMVVRSKARRYITTQKV